MSREDAARYGFRHSSRKKMASIRASNAGSAPEARHWAAFVTHEFVLNLLNLDLLVLSAEPSGE